MQIPVRIKAFRPHNGKKVALPRAGVTCIVGGNNVGKSQLLSELATRAGHPHQASSIILAELELDKPVVTLDEAAGFLRTYGVPQQSAPGQVTYYTAETGGSHLAASHFLENFSAANCLANTQPFFVWYASAGSLLTVASSSVPLGAEFSLATNPVGRLFRDGDLEAELCQLARDAFGLSLTLDRINGEVLLRVGTPSGPAPPIDRPTRTYADEVAALPPLSQQGDGVKSFLGIALSVLAGSCQVLLIDEPEAFLHPSQARTLGRWLATQAQARDLQVILATHDKDLLLGLLEADSGRSLTVLTLSRGADSESHQVRPDEIAEIWRDPVLRYSNLLQGLFHRQVVICEADADCRFYNAVLDTIAVEHGARHRSDDTLFVPSGGKQRVASMARSVQALGVETWVVVDFDALTRKRDVKEIVASLGHDWTDDLDRDYATFSSPLNQSSLWPIVKKAGLSGVPSGEAHQAAERLLGALRQRRLLVVPVGEMEDFQKGIGTHGASWVSTMLQQNGHRTCAAAQDLIRPILRAH